MKCWERSYFFSSHSLNGRLHNLRKILQLASRFFLQVHAILKHYLFSTSIFFKNVYIRLLKQITDLESCSMNSFVTRGGRPTTSISSPNHILIIFSSNHIEILVLSILFFFKCPILENKYIF